MEPESTWKKLKKPEKIFKKFEVRTIPKKHKYDTNLCIVEQFDFLKYSDAYAGKPKGV